MHTSPLSRYIKYFRRKIALISERIPKEPHSDFDKGTLMLMDRIESNLVPQEAITMAALKTLDGELEATSVLVIGRKKTSEVAQLLAKELGFGRIADDPFILLKRVLKNGRASGRHEQDWVRDVLSGGTAEQFLSEAESVQLQNIAAKQGL